jgi:hypothetical protein
MNKHKHDYKQTGTVMLPTGEYLYDARYMNGGSVGIQEVKDEALVFICHCGDVFVKPIKSLTKKSKYK